MNDPLGRRLKEMVTPAPSESARARAKHRALLAFQQVPLVASSSPGHKGLFALGWFGLGALAAVFALMVILLNRPQASVAENVAGDRQMLRQLEALFPHQLDSVVEENGKIELSVGSSAMVGGDQPIVVVFRKDKQAIRILSYSGHHVCVSLGAEHHCFDLLATPTGGVILVSGNDVLTGLGKDRPVVAGYSVRAQTLEAAL